MNRRNTCAADKPFFVIDSGLLNFCDSLNDTFSVHSRLQGMPFTPGSYKPIADDEFAVVIFCTKHEEEKASKLKHELETVQDIKPISINAEDWETSRTIVLLLSKHTQTEEGKNHPRFSCHLSNQVDPS